MTHRTTPEFWELYDKMPVSVQRVADKNYELLKTDPRHPSLHLKEVQSGVWSVRVGIGCRALATFEEDTFYWFWIGTHAKYNQLIN